MGLPPLSKIPFILRPQAWLHRRHYGEVLSPIRWWGRIPFIFYLVSMFVGWLERKRSPLDPVVRSLVSARIAQMCLCEFCVDITSMKVAERTGSTDKLLAVADWRQSPLFSDEERLALEYAEAASVTPPTVANFLLSPDAQLRKADPAVWGDPSVLDPQKLPDGQRETLQSRMPQDLPPVLAEPHAGWVNALEQEWLHRYGTH
ncbi:hypothetical protein G7711_001271 [Escherichia coli]|nr:hypothetical protein [Escherichia coli]ELD91142.1 protein ynjB [Escherichia coli KTE47]EOW36664.1 protein ynjB [Escherichia coli KTE126]EEZ6563878.1 hypothetical protein [Escherichia coli]EFH6118473.1 hypothetical protein [Escherichia coli]